MFIQRSVQGNTKDMLRVSKIHAILKKQSNLETDEASQITL